ncbi:PLP-dependent aminotransferase family protein [Mucilaginibacter sp.]|uniref:MocR-like pyridoxine biosynthesis transcription factor PdxR n=1 Tax=Mucilaginibacter sp. TaxID=1882438 RepID=UPI0035BC13C7
MQFTLGLLDIDKTHYSPVYLQIANGIIGHIQQGKLKPATPLPSSRMLAVALNVHRNTVVAAYDELYAQSWVDVFPRKGIFVAANLPDVSSRPIPTTVRLDGYPEKTYFEIDENRVPPADFFKEIAGQNLHINTGMPDTRLAPIELMVREYRRFAGHHFTHKYLKYGPEQGSLNLRTELARFLGESRGLQVTANDILITKGAQMAIYLAAQVLLSKNDIVIAGDPGYAGANEIFEHAGAKLELVPVDEQGMDIDAVEEICKRKKVKLLFVIPHHHQPTTVTLSSDRRMQLLELAKKYRFAIIEDDYDYDFHYSSTPILPLASADYYGSVVYVGSFCKTIAPGIRIGFMIAPKNLITQATRLRRLIDRQGEQLLEEAVANLLKNGDIGRHLKKANKIYHERRDIFCRLLHEKLGDKVSFKIPDGGFAIWIKLLTGINPTELADKTEGMGLTITDCGDYFYNATSQPPYMRLGFASLNAQEIEQAVEIIARAIDKLS